MTAAASDTISEFWVAVQSNSSGSPFETPRTSQNARHARGQREREGERRDYRRDSRPFPSAELGGFGLPRRTRARAIVALTPASVAFH